MDADHANLTLPDLQLSWASQTDTGKVRKLNEDSMFAAPGVYVVADGMGGHAAGDVASRLTIETFAEIVTGHALDLSVIAEVISNSNQRVRDYASKHGHDGMGCTVVGALLVDNAGESSLVVFNVGDARCYVLVDDQLIQLTNDHSLVQEMVDSGEIPASSARTHPQRNVVTRAVGIEPTVVADFVVAPRTSLRMLLCSDGVHGELTDERIAVLLGGTGSPDAITRSIIDAVLEGRAADNATAMVIDVVHPLGPDVTALDEIDVTGPRRSIVSVVTEAEAKRSRDDVAGEPEITMDSTPVWNDQIGAPPLPKVDILDAVPELRPTSNVVIDSVPS